MAYGVDYPKGVAVAGARSEALFAADNETRDPYDREHVMPFVMKRPDRFRMKKIHCPWKDAAKFAISIDTSDDIEQARRIFSALGDDPSIPDVIRFLENTSIE